MRKGLVVSLSVVAALLVSVGPVASAGAGADAHVAKAKVRVPGLVGVPWKTAKYVFQGVGVKTKIVHPGKLVVKTSPKANTLVRPGSLVKVWLG
jgi:PASTA domain